MKTPRQIAIADHLWEAFGKMAEEMGTEREALVNQAMHAFARQHGFVGPAAPPEAGSHPPPVPDRSDRSAVAERVLETAARLERDMQERTPPDAASIPQPSSELAAAGAPEPGHPPSLVLVLEDGTEVEVSKDRFVIGRGRHCDLVVDGAKISREHAAVFRDAEGRWNVEDLGSSNGTWFRRERIARRRIEDGDEYFVCSERIRCALR